MTLFRSHFLALVLIAIAFIAPASLGHAQDYVLGPDDVLELVVYGETDLSKSYRVGSGGGISVPLIGEVMVGGLNLAAAEVLIAEKLADGYLVDPSVSIQIAEARPFYIMGEVKNPGSYRYVANMTALNAVALAGGYTYRAKESSVEITRGAERIKIEPEAKILPGDVVTVDERFF